MQVKARGSLTTEQIGHEASTGDAGDFAFVAGGTFSFFDSGLEKWVPVSFEIDGLGSVGFDGLDPPDSRGGFDSLVGFDA
jgi:hypothetical protein